MEVFAASTLLSCQQCDQVIVEVDPPAPDKPSDETVAPADILIATSREPPIQNYSRIPDPQKLWEIKIY